MPKSLTVTALEGVPMVEPGDDIVDIIIAALQESKKILVTGDIVVLAQKIVSKAEARYVDLKTVSPSPEALELAKLVDKDARLVEVILSQSTEVVRYRPGVLIVQHKLGFVHANAGIDQSNLPKSGDKECVLLLPENPDKSAQSIREKLNAHFDVNVSVIINDSFGRAWRHGSVGIAIGSAGFPALYDLRGQQDLFGRELEITQVALADELAATASLLMGQAGEGTPIVVISGVQLPLSSSTVNELIRPKEEDLFR